MKNVIQFLLLCWVCLGTAQVSITHTANRSNTSGHITTLDSKFTNGKPGAILIVTQKFGVYNANEIGVWYNAGKWTIYNQNKKTLPANAIFNVLVFPKGSKNAFVHTTTASNTSKHITTLSSSLTNNKPNALVFVTQNFGKYNSSNVGAWYNGGKWKVYNENTKNPMPLGTKLNVLVLNKGKNRLGSLTLDAFSYNNTSNGHVSTIKAPSTLSKSAVLFATSNYKNTYNPNVTGVWLNGANWTVFNQNKRPLPKNTQFNVLAVSGSKGLTSTGMRPRPAPKYLPKVYKKSLLLPGAIKKQNISYILEDNLAIYQGDIVLGDKGSNIDLKPDPHPVKRDFTKLKNSFGSSDSHLFQRVSSGVVDKNWLWPNGIIPYTIHSGGPLADRFSKTEKETIKEAINEINSKTNLNVVPHNGQLHHVVFVKKTGLGGGSSRVGRTRLWQRIRLGEDVGKGLIMHEILHAAGFWHEQSRGDRDKYVKILLENVEEGEEHNFEKHVDTGFKITPYDRNSIMHYHGNAFSKNGQPTIVDSKTNQPVGAQRRGLSAKDIDGITRVYPKDHISFVTRPITSYRQIRINISKVSSKDWDGNVGGKKDIDFYAECELGPGWDWTPRNSSNRTETFESEVVEKYGNNISPNWNFKYGIPKNENYAKIWVKLYDEDTASDEVIDINPFNEKKPIQLFVDTRNGRIYLGEKGKQEDYNYLGQVGEELTLEGYEGTSQDIRAKITFTVKIE